MHKFFFWLIIFPSLCFILQSAYLKAESLPECSGVTGETALSSTLASAGVWANMLGRDHSVSEQVERLMREGIKHVSGIKPPPPKCLDSCSSLTAPVIHISSVPNKTLTSESAQRECLEHKQRSQQSPFIAKNMEFENFDELNEWVGDFSRGEGSEGERLYKYCPGNCSPSYRYSVTVAGYDDSDDSGDFLLRSVATCGLPRDKDDDQYQLKTSYEWTCSK